MVDDDDASKLDLIRQGRSWFYEPGLQELLGDDGGNPAATALAEIEVTVSDLVPNRPAFALGLRWLERHLPGPPPRHTVVHSDIRNGNLIINKDGLAAVLDWEGARRSGDPMQDLAWPALRMWRYFRFETERWSESDHPWIESSDDSGEDE